MMAVIRVYDATGNVIFASLVVAEIGERQNGFASNRHRNATAQEIRVSKLPCHVTCGDSGFNNRRTPTYDPQLRQDRTN
jgi:hypothetical protein